jgi:hypothetical protein
MAYDSIAILTNETKRRMAEGWETGKSFRVRYFSISATGHDPTDPTVALSIDPSATDIGGSIFGPEPIDRYEYTSDYCPVFVCAVQKRELIGPVSALGLWAETTCVPAGDPEPAGTLFLFAIHHRPLLVFTGADSAEFNVSVFM